MILRIAIAAVLVVLLSYGLLKAWPLLSGPTIMLSTPTDSQTISGGIVEVTGVAKRTESLVLNGAPLLIDEAGNFSTTLVLPPGSAILRLTASDRFGRKTSVERPVFVSD